MKINLKRIGIAAVTVFVLCGAVTCVDQEVLTLGTEATLLGLTVGDITAAEIPQPITSNAWNSETGLYGEDFKSIAFLREQDITNARIKPSVSKGAMTEWGIGTRTNRPNYFSNTRVPATFESEDFIYIKVTSEDQAAVNYYRYSASVFSWVNDLASISINGRVIKAGDGAVKLENVTVPPVTDEERTIYITSDEAQNAVVEAVTFDPNATIAYNRTGVLAASPPDQFLPSGSPIVFEDDDFLYVEVTAQNTIDKKYFKFKVFVGRMTTIKTLQLTLKGGPVQLYGLGLSKSVWADVGPGEFKTAAVDQPDAGFGINIELDDPKGKVSITRVSSLPTSVNDLNFSPYSAGGSAGIFTNGQYLVIRVEAELPSELRYYQVKVELLAANIKAQPKSAWYYADGVEGGSPDGHKVKQPLTIEFDGGDEGFTYTWYESDSLFGIYGRHGVSMDEKNNISTINGGPDMYYYLVEPGINQYGVAAAPGITANDPKAREALAWPAGSGVDSNGVAYGVQAGGKAYLPRTDWKDVPIRLPGDAAQNSSYPVKPSSPMYNYDSNTASDGDPFKLGPNAIPNEFNPDGTPISYPAYGDSLPAPPAKSVTTGWLLPTPLPA